jgi:hypothetical protein
LDKVQASFKQVVSKVSVKGDPLLLLSKRIVEHAGPKSSEKIAAEVIQTASNSVRLDYQRLYSQFVGRCLELGEDVGMDAKTFYALARAEDRSCEALRAQ